ncbi:MAG: ankyrin repeat domain-containing protein [Acidobacteria bacterium]|nr:ankyrin repeat domain-containing protein [Acidobacteriota bacterium]
MKLTRLPLRSSLTAYFNQANQLLQGHQQGEPWAIQALHHLHPRFLQSEVKWLPQPLTAERIQAAEVTSDDARLAVARYYNFQDWNALAQHLDAILAGGGVFRFESAVEAVIAGDLPALQALLAEEPELVRARSTRVTHFDPPVHRATLLHYLAANGVENYRQRSPANAVEVARALLDAGAEPDSLADLYGGQCTTLSLLVSSGVPTPEVQLGLAELLLDRGAAVDGQGAGNWVNPLRTALAFGFMDAARLLATRGARLDLAAAAGLGDAARAAELLPSADGPVRHAALALAAQLGQVETLRLLLEFGEDPNRYNPAGLHAHATPLHHAALAGHAEAARLLVAHGARRDMPDKHWHATPAGWARHSGHQDLARELDL